MTRHSSRALQFRRRREGRPARIADPSRAAETRPARGTGSAGGATVARTDAYPRRLDVPQDRATYACRCGYVFEATVSTTVGCPHCGDAQAW